MLDNLFTRWNNDKDKEQKRKGAFDYFENKYFKNPFKVTELFDPGERVLAKKLKYFIPGRIYTWKYDPKYMDQLPYYDKRPIVLIQGQMTTAAGNLIVQGINLNYFPEGSRAQLIGIYEDSFKKDIEEAKALVNKGQVGILKNAVLNLTNWDFMLKMFDGGGKINLSFGCRNYLLSNITEPVLIEFGDYDLLPFFIPKDFMGYPPAKVYQLYGLAKQEAAKNPKKPNADKAKKIQKRFTKPGG